MSNKVPSVYPHVAVNRDTFDGPSRLLALGWVDHTYYSVDPSVEVSGITLVNVSTSDTGAGVNRTHLSTGAYEHGRCPIGSEISS